jgi:hypothetical protein
MAGQRLDMLCHTSAARGPASPICQNIPPEPILRKCRYLQAHMQKKSLCGDFADFATNLWPVRNKHYIRTVKKAGCCVLASLFDQKWRFGASIASENYD